MSSSRPRATSTKQVTYSVWCSPLALSILCSSIPRALRLSRRLGSSTRGSPWRRTQFIAHSQPTPNSRATWVTDEPSWPTFRQISAAALLVSESSTRSLFSVNDLAEQSESRQIHFRFLHTKRTGRPPEARQIDQHDHRSLLHPGHHSAPSTPAAVDPGLDVDLEHLVDLVH